MGVLQKVTFYGHMILDFAHLEKKETGYNCLCYIVGPHCLFILNVIVSIY